MTQKAVEVDRDRHDASNVADSRERMLTEDEMVRLLMRERVRILGYVRSIVGHAEMAEDIFQEVAVVALRKRSEVTELRSPGAWFRKIARLQSMNAIRKKKAAGLDPAVLDLLDAVWDQRDLDGSLRVEGLRECIGKLPDKIKRVVELRYNQSLGSQVVANQLSLPINTVYVYVSRAHRMLKDCIERYVARKTQQQGS
ncbi:MAG: sigma-70 family RNA polymerase sigma factor [Planctomycetota bacterium]